MAAAFLVALPTGPMAHEIPASVTVHAFVRPEGERLHLLLRVLLTSMRDVQFPVRDAGYLDIEATQPLLPGLIKQWIADYTTFFENGNRVGEPVIRAARLSLPSDPAFANYDDAVAKLNAPGLPSDTDLVPEQTMLDVWLEYPIESAESRFSIDPEWAHLGIRTSTVLRFRPPGGAERVFRYDGNPGVVRLDPRWFQAASTFTRLGFGHILGGIDHLLFIFCLVIPFRRIRPLVVIVTSFTVAHSITLIASALGFAPGALWFPPFIEVLIALSIVYMALENIVGPNLRRRWLIAFGFGLIHGFGFSFALRESLQFAGSHLVTSLLSFNVGVELGQIFVLAVAIPLLVALFRYVVAERLGTIILSALVGHTAWHWMTDRWSDVRQYDIAWPTLDAGLLIAAMRGVMLLLILLGVVWALSATLGRLLPGAGEHETAAARKAR